MESTERELEMNALKQNRREQFQQFQIMLREEEEKQKDLKIKVTLSIKKKIPRNLLHISFFFIVWRVILGGECVKENIWSFISI